jgi:23S rRNA pseudouridine2604 synthase
MKHSEESKRKIRRMCEVLGNEVKDLKRVRIMNIELGFLSPNNVRRIKGEELDQFLLELGVKKKAI